MRGVLHSGLGGAHSGSGPAATTGTATLSDGTVTVNTTAVTSAAKFLLSYSAISGVPGNLSITNRVNGTSFDIISTSASDNSDVTWELNIPA